MPRPPRRVPSLAELFDELREPLGLSAVYLDRVQPPALPSGGGARAFPTLVGHLNLVQPNRIQVLGPTEIAYWNARSDRERGELMGRLFVGELLGLIVTDGLEPPRDLAARARHEGVALLQSTHECEHVIATLRHFLERAMAARAIRHGVFLDVLGVGVLLTGESSVGKSELALELISRGHSLVADDAPEFTRTAPDAVDGEAPPLIQDFLEVSGIGVLNIRAMYGDAAIRHQKRLQLIIHMEPLTGALREQLDRLNGNFSTSDVLGIAVPTMTLPVAPGRNLAVLVEAAIRNFLLSRRGYNAAEELMQRHSRAMERDAPCD